MIVWGFSYCFLDISQIHYLDTVSLTGVSMLDNLPFGQRKVRAFSKFLLRANLCLRVFLAPPFSPPMRPASFVSMLYPYHKPF
jgi:hypothetical protein